MSICCKGEDLLFIVEFIKLWFGGSCKVSEIPCEEYAHVMTFFRR